MFHDNVEGLFYRQLTVIQRGEYGIILEQIDT